MDFGNAFRVFDTDGEELKPCLISKITQEKEGLVILHDDKRHPFQNDDHVTFKEVQGMTEVNGKTFQLKVFCQRRLNLLLPFVLETPRSSRPTPAKALWNRSKCL